VKWFDRTKTALWRVLLRLSAQDHKPSGYAVVDTTFCDRENAPSITAAGRITGFRHSKQPLDQHRNPSNSGRSLNDRETPRHTVRLTGGPLQRVGLASPAANKGDKWIELREKLRKKGVRVLIKHQELRAIDHAHNARTDRHR
jgi:IS5 family transposase